MASALFHGPSPAPARGRWQGSRVVRLYGYPAPAPKTTGRASRDVTAAPTAALADFSRELLAFEQEVEMCLELLHACFTVKGDAVIVVRVTTLRDLIEEEA